MQNQSKNPTSSYLLIEWNGATFPTNYPQPYLICTDNIANIVHQNNGSGGGGYDAIRINYFLSGSSTAPKVELEYTGGLSLNDATETINSLIQAIRESQQFLNAKWDANQHTSVLGNVLSTITVVV